MRERQVRILKMVCTGLAVLFLFKLSRVLIIKDPLAGVDLAELEAAKSRVTATSTTNSAAVIKPEARPSSGKNSLPRNLLSTRSRPQSPGLPAGIQARVDQIKDSEILGPVQRPLPMALLGIAGKDAFLRSPNGQTGLLREGEELGGVKLLQIGTNRVLIEHEGQKKELTLFEGFGSESLLQPEKESKQ